MQDLVPITLRATKDNDLIDIIWALSTFFKELCADELTIEKLNKAGANVVVTLCRMEKLFPPSFFTIMFHLIAHLIEEATLGVLVLLRWMYPIKRLEFTFPIYT